MSDVQVKYDKDVFIPGENVTGTVIITNREPLKANYLKVCIHGDAHTKWTESEGHHRTNLEGEREFHSDNVEYSNTVNYLTAVAIVWRSTDGTNVLPPGQNIFPFSFPLPSNCPPTFNGFHGHVRYSVHVELDRPEIWKFNKEAERCFTVIAPLDLNTCPGALSPIINSSTRNTGLVFKNGVVTMTASLPKQGFTPQEVIPITVDIDNGSKKEVVAVRAYLYQCSHYVGTRRQTSLFSFHSDSCNQHTHQKNEEKQLQDARRACKIGPRTSGQVAITLKVPRTIPSFQSQIISVDYHITVFVDTMSTFGGVLKCTFPLSIGTIPVGKVHGVPVNRPVPSAPMAVEYSVFPSAPSYPELEQSENEPFSAPPAYSPGPSAPSVPLTPSAPPSYEESMHLMSGSNIPLEMTASEQSVELSTPTPVHL